MKRRQLPAAFEAMVSAKTDAVAILADKTLKGAQPGEMPFEQSTKLERVVNHKAARAFGLRVPASVLVSADKALE